MMPEMIFDEIMIAYKEMIDDKIKMLISDKLMIAETETDIDRESRQFQLKVLKKRSEEMLQQENGKGAVYTQAQYKQKVENLQYNFDVLSKLNQEGNMD